MYLIIWTFVHMCAKLLQSGATVWTVACQALLFMVFSRQEYLSGLPCPPPGDLPNPGIKPRSPILQADSLPTELQGKSMLSLVMWKENTLKI